MSTAEAWTVGRLLNWTADYLKKNGSTSPRLDAEVLLAEARGCQRIELYTAFSEEPSEQVRASFKEMVRRRAEGTPVAYLVGSKEFFSLNFEVNPDVLIPRPETEHLVVEAVERAKLLTGQTAAVETEKRTGNTTQSAPKSETTEADSGAGEGSPIRPRPVRTYSGIKICDIGTGSGAVAIALAKTLPGASLTAGDISSAALSLAERNAQRHSVDNQLRFLESDLFSKITDRDFDIVVSNPPYISEAEYAQLPKSVREYEPRGALVGGESGSEIIARLITEAHSHLKPGGWLLIELSPMLASQVMPLFSEPNWNSASIIKDLAGHARVVAARRG